MASSFPHHLAPLSVGRIPGVIFCSLGLPNIINKLCVSTLSIFKVELSHNQLGKHNLY
jgi:hypothetical protein